MHGPTCVFWANLTPFSLQPLSFTATFREAVARRGGGGLRWRALYAGLPVTLLRAVPMNAAVLLTYEGVMALSAP